MNIILLGAPGSGKGTLAKKLLKELSLAHISTGDLLREAVQQGTELGKKAKTYMNEGKLVPDSLIIDLMDERLKAADCKKGFILDGFPRTVVQAEALEQLLLNNKLELDKVIDLEVSEDEVVQRITGRMQCKACGAIYHKTNMPPKQNNICDVCGGELYQRADDQEETVRKRFKVYLEQTSPLIDFYHKKGKVVSIDGSISPEATLEKALDIIN